MATFTASAAQANVPAFFNVNGTVTRTIKYTHSVAFSVGDIVQMVRVPNGATVSEVRFGCSASAGAITAIVGDGNNKSAYAAASVLSGSATYQSIFTGIGRSYSAEDTIDIEVTALSAVPGTVDLVLKVDYTLSNSGQG